MYRTNTSLTRFLLVRQISVCHPSSTLLLHLWLHCLASESAILLSSCHSIYCALCASCLRLPCWFQSPGVQPLCIWHASWHKLRVFNQPCRVSILWNYNSKIPQCPASSSVSTISVSTCCLVMDSYTIFKHNMQLTSWLFKLHGHKAPPIPRRIANQTYDTRMHCQEHTVVTSQGY